MDAIRARWVRGGTSKCWVFEAQDIADTGISAGTLLPRLFGSPDLRQLDGVGGGTSTTSKAVVLEPSQRAGIDVDFTFAQVGIDEPVVDWGSNCGNCSSSAGLYAVEAGWVPLQDPLTKVVTYNTNTDQTIIQRIPTPHGRLPETMTASIPGAVFNGYEVGLGFVDPNGKTTGKLLPAGSGRTTLQADGRDWEVSMVDAGAPLVIVEATTLGLNAESHADWSQEITQHLPALDALRRAGAVAMGMVEKPQDAQRAVPKLGIVAASHDDLADLNVLMLSMGAPHPAMPITGSVAFTAAAMTPGTIPFDLAGGDLGRASSKVDVKDDSAQELRLRTPAGVLATFVDDSTENTVVGITRTARTIAEAVLPIPEYAQMIQRAGSNQPLQEVS